MGWDPLIIDSPGLFRCRIEFAVTDPTSMDNESATLALHRFKLVFEDHDLIRRLETNAAWRRRERSPGYLKSFFSRIIGPERDAVGRFASLTRGPGSLEVVLDPPRPMSRSDLEALIGNPHRAKRKLGFQVMFTESAHR
jgi:hypothetical protein